MNDLKSPSRKSFMKTLEKQLHIFSYFLIQFNRISLPFYSLLLFLDMTFLLLLPIQPLLTYVSSTTGAQSSVTKLNLILYLGKLSFFPYVSETINGILLLSTLLLVHQVWTFDSKRELRRSGSKPLYTCLSYLLVLNGKALFSPLFSIQILSVRCYFSGQVCSQQTDLVRLVTNILGILLLFGQLFMHFKLNMTSLPIKRIVWAKPSDRLNNITKLFHIFQSLIISFEDYLDLKISFVIVLALIEALLTSYLWINIFKIEAFNKFIDRQMVFKISTLWALTLFSIIISISPTKLSDVFMTIIGFLSAIFISILNILLKESLLSRGLLADEYKNESAIYKMLCQFNYLASSSRNADDIILKEFLLKHMENCQEEGCPCKEGLEKETQEDEDAGRDDSLLISHIELQKQSCKAQFFESDESADVKSKRARLIFHIIIARSSNLYSKVKSLEIYEKVSSYKIFYSTFFSITTIRERNRSSFEDQVYYYLKYLILEEIKNFEKQDDSKRIDLDAKLYLDKQFKHYSSVMLSTSIMVENYWQAFNKKDMDISQTIQIGVQIVDSYIQLKDLYSSILESAPDFTEVVILNIQFYTEIMNFEMEAQQGTDLLKNMKQKIKIEQQNYYHIRLESVGMAIISFQSSQKNKLLLSNQVLNDLIDYQECQLKERDISMFIPGFMHSIHEKFLEGYLTNEQNINNSGKMRRIWVLNSDQQIIPCDITLQTFASKRHGFLVGAFFKPDAEFYTSKSKRKLGEQQTITFLANEQGQIQHISAELGSKYEYLEQIVSEETKINLNEIFPEIYDYSDEDLANGIETIIFKSSNSIEISMKPIQKGQLKILIHRYSPQFAIKEVIFKEMSNRTISGEILRRQKGDIGKLTNDIQEAEEAQENSDNENDQNYKFDPRFHENSASSSTGSASNTYNILQQLKGQVDFNNTPVTILNLRRSLIFFFLTLILTSFSILTVSQISTNNFLVEMSQVKDSILIANSISNYRLSFRYFLQTRNHNYIPYSTFQKDVEFMKQQSLKFIQRIQTSLNSQQQSKNNLSPQLYQLQYASNLVIESINADVTINHDNSSFQIGIMQFLTKGLSILNLDQPTLLSLYSNFSYQHLTAPLAPSQRDSYYILVNGYDAFNDIASTIADQYIADSNASGNGYSLTILIICMSCAFITSIATLMLLPTIFKLDQEQEAIIKKWFMVTPETRKSVLLKIQNFNLSNSAKQKNKKQEADISDFEEEFLSVNSIQKHKKQKIRMSHEPHSASDSLSQSMDNSFNAILNHTLNVPQGNFANNKATTNQTSYTHQTINDLFIAQTLEQRIPPDHSQQKNQELNISIQSVDTSDHINRSTQLQKLTQIYYGKKFRKFLILLGYSLIIIGFYSGSYFFSKSIFGDAQQSYSYFKLSNQRVPCLVNSLMYWIGQNQLNKTIMTNYGKDTALEYVHFNCSDLENTFDDLFSTPPRQIKPIQQKIKQLNKQNVCLASFTNQSDILACENALDGVFLNGVKNLINLVTYHTTSLFQIFETISPELRTAAFLRDNQYAVKTEEYVFIVFKYGIQFLDFITETLEVQLIADIKQQSDYFVLAFSLFICFLCLSLLAMLRGVLEVLKKEVFRTRIIIKLIPASELMIIESSGTNKHQRRKPQNKFFK